SGLDDLDWPEGIKAMQRNWVGKSQGAEIDFRVAGSERRIGVYTTRPDTLWGATFLVLAPEHPLVLEVVTGPQRQAIEAYIRRSSQRTEIERAAEGREKTGV